jgi:hypothetical protein
VKRLLLTLIAAIAATGAGAQGVSRVTEELARADFGSDARIEIRYDGDARAAIQSADLNSGPTRVTTYGVSLFRDNSQNAGANAREVRARFAGAFPGVPVTLSYENPWFKVEAGSFVDRIEAVALYGRVLGDFRQAVVIQQEASLTAIVNAERAEPPTMPDETEE